MSNYISGAVASVLTLAISKGLPLLWQTFDRRHIDPKRQQQNFFIEQGSWHTNRAELLAGFRFELLNGGGADKFKLGLLISKLDRKDSEWAMKETDIDLLARLAAQKAAECHNNAAECARHADEINSRAFIFPIA
jgi:hypothetical protein